MKQEPLSSRTPDMDKMKVLARRLKKADDVARLFPSKPHWLWFQRQLRTLRVQVDDWIRDDVS